jgi:hypothetical protein
MYFVDINESIPQDTRAEPKRSGSAVLSQKSGRTTSQGFGFSPAIQ